MSDLKKDVDDLTSQELPFKIQVEHSVVKTHHVYFGEVVEDTHLYVDLVHSLRVASPNDKFLFHLYNYGGSCHTGAFLINAIRSSAAIVTMSVEAPCYSMGAVLALSGDSLMIHPHTFLMFHNYSAGFGGKGGELGERVKNEDRILKSLDHIVCAPFLTKKEIAAIDSDRDVYVHHDDEDLQARLTRHFPNAFNGDKKQ